MKKIYVVKAHNEWKDVDGITNVGHEYNYTEFYTSMKKAIEAIESHLNYIDRKHGNEYTTNHYNKETNSASYETNGTITHLTIKIHYLW